MLVLIDCYGCEHKKTMDCHLSCANKDAPIRSRRTNADRIRNMTDEELAKYLDGVCHDLWQMFVADSEKMWLEWLRKEAE